MINKLKQLLEAGTIGQDEAQELSSLPDGSTVNRHIYLSFDHLESLPNNLTVNGGLSLLGCTPIDTLPSGLIVTGSLGLTGTNIKKLPPDLIVGQQLQLSGTECNPFSTLDVDCDTIVWLELEFVNQYYQLVKSGKLRKAQAKLKLSDAVYDAGMGHLLK